MNFPDDIYGYEPSPKTITFKFYLHGSKDSNLSKLEEDPALAKGDFSEEAKSQFMGLGYEVEFDCEVDVETGVVVAHRVNGVGLMGPVKI